MKQIEKKKERNTGGKELRFVHTSKRRKKKFPPLIKHLRGGKGRFG